MSAAVIEYFDVFKILKRVSPLVLYFHVFTNTGNKVIDSLTPLTMIIDSHSFHHSTISNKVA